MARAPRGGAALGPRVAVPAAAQRRSPRPLAAVDAAEPSTNKVVRRMLVDGTAWTSGSKWHGRAVLRVAVCNWSTTDADVDATLAALHRAAT